MAEKFNIYSMVTDRIVAMMDNGIIPWERPWTGSTLCLKRHNGKPYSFINQLLLSPNFDGSIESLNSGEFATFKQIKDEGGHLNKGAKGIRVVFWKPLLVTKTDEDGTERQEMIPFLRYSTVFNIKDTDLEPKWSHEQVKVAEPNQMAEDILETYWTTEGVKVHRDKLSGKAFYSPTSDSITLPSIEQFEDTAEYYSTAFHESVHSTGHSSRLDRIKVAAMFGSNDYGKEELVAEIGASALVSICGIETPSSFRNNAAYIQNWRNAIAKDNRLIISATGKAEKAVDRILNPVSSMV